MRKKARDRGTGCAPSPCTSECGARAQSLRDGTVTVRYRDSMRQRRVAADALVAEVAVHRMPLPEQPDAAAPAAAGSE